MERYRVDQRVGCIAIRDCNNTNPDDQGLHPDTQGVVWFRSGTKSGSMVWEISSDTVRLAELECEKLNELEQRNQAVNDYMRKRQVEEDSETY
jgi:hypothetical protein